MRHGTPAPTVLHGARLVARPRTTVALPAIALLLAACGGGDPDAPASTRLDTVDGVVQVRRDPSVPPFLRGHRLYVATRDSLGIQRVQVFGIGEARP